MTAVALCIVESQTTDPHRKQLTPVNHNMCVFVVFADVLLIACSLLCVCCLAGIAPGEFVYMLNNGPETDTAIYDGTNNGVGLTEFTAQVTSSVWGRK